MDFCRAMAVSLAILSPARKIQPMLISKMNRFCDRHGRTALVIIAVAFLLPLLYSWAPGSRMFGTGGGRRLPKYVGEMHGKKLPRTAFLEQMYAFELPYLLQSGRWLHEDSRYMPMLTEQALTRLRLLHEARRLGLDKVGQAEVDERIRLMFSAGDGFSKEFYKHFVGRILPQVEMSEKDFNRLIADSLAIERVQQRIVEAVAVSAAEVDEQIRRERALYSTELAVFSSGNLMADAQVVTDAEIERHFEANQASLRQPDARMVKFVAFDPKRFEPTVDITEAQVATYFQQRQAAYESQNKTLEEATPEIRRLLLERETRTKARQVAEDIARSLAATELAGRNPVELFDTICATFEATPAVAGPFSKYSGGVIAGLEGVSLRFQDMTAKLTPEQPFSGSFADLGIFYVACLQEIIPGGEASELTPELRAAIREQLEVGLARDYYQTQVEPFRPLLAGIDTTDDLKSAFAADQLASRLPEHLASLTPDAFGKLVDERLRPYFVATERQVRVVTFNPDDFKAKVGKITDADLAATFERERDTYAEKIKASHILLKSEGNTSPEQRDALRQQLGEIRQQLVDGADFAELATQHSDCPSSARGGDLGFFGRNSMVRPFEVAAFALAPGEISEVVETQFGYHLIKVTEQQAAKTLDEVKDELRDKALADKARELAANAADEFAYEAFDQVEGRPAGLAPAEAFAAFAKAQGYTTEDTRWFGKRGFTPPFIGDWNAVGQAFEVNELQPVSQVIQGNAKSYVVAWMGTKDSSLPAFAGDDAELVSGIVNLLQRELAVRQARQQAAAAAAEIQAKLAAGEEIGQLKQAHGFAPVPEFSLAQPPANHPQVEILKAVAAETPAAATLATPRDTDQGAVLVFVANVVDLGDDELASFREETKTTLLNSRRQEAMQSFLADLEKSSKTTLREEFDYR